MRCGAARADITPDPPVLMGGYIGRTSPAEGVHDPLFARAMVLEDGATRVAIVGADLLTADRGLVARVRASIQQDVGIPPSHCLVAFSHTHSGPLVSSRSESDLDPGYVQRVEETLVDVVRRAASDLRPARVGAGQIKLYLGLNRRERQPDGSIALGKNPTGYASPYCRILVAIEESHGPMAIFFTYGAHPVVLGPENLEISGDYAGHAERMVEENFGGHAVALFALGFAGDVNVACQKRDFDEVETIGTALARAVIEELKEMETSAEATLSATSTIVPLPAEPPPSPTEAERLLYTERERLADLLGRGEDRTEVEHHRRMVEWASRLVELSRWSDTDPTIDLEVQTMRVGGAAIAALSAEVFAEFEKKALPLSPLQPTFFVSNANGNIGYLPTAEAMAEGGYEVEVAHRYFGALRLAPQAPTVAEQALHAALFDLASVREPTTQP